jgi:hypothetical protein
MEVAKITLFNGQVYYTEGERGHLETSEPRKGGAMTEVIDLLNDVAEFLEGQSDVDDGSYGEQVPNRAMSLLTAVEQEIERLKCSIATTCSPTVNKDDRG